MREELCAFVTCNSAVYLRPKGGGPAFAESGATRRACARRRYLAAPRNPPRAQPKEWAAVVAGALDLVDQENGREERMPAPDWRDALELEVRDTTVYVVERPAASGPNGGRPAAGTYAIFVGEDGGRNTLLLPTLVAFDRHERRPRQSHRRRPDRESQPRAIDRGASDRRRGLLVVDGGETGCPRSARPHCRPAPNRRLRHNSLGSGAPKQELHALR